MKYQRMVQTSVFGNRFRNKLFYNFWGDRDFRLDSKVLSSENPFVIKIQLSQIHTESNLITFLGQIGLFKQHEASIKVGRTCSLELIIAITFEYPAMLLCTVFRSFFSSSTLLANVLQRHTWFYSLIEMSSFPSFFLSSIIKSTLFIPLEMHTEEHDTQGKGILPSDNWCGKRRD